MPPPPIHRAQLEQAAELLTEILAAQSPADRLMERYFRLHRNMGARDRAFVAEAVYGVLHRRRQLDALLAAARWAPPLPPQIGPGGAASSAPPHPPQIGPGDEPGSALPPPPESGPGGEHAAAVQLHSSGGPGPERETGLGYVLAYVLAVGGWSAGALAQRGFPREEAALLPHVGAARDPALPFAVRANLPDWLAGRLVAELGEPEAAALASALHQPATLDLRVNALRATREAALEALLAAGFAAEPTPYSPVGLRARGRKPLQSLPAFRDGWFEVQDEGSQLVSLLLEPRRGQKLADFCAGAGGKSLHLAALLENRGSVDAFDISKRRLQGLRDRLRRAGLDNIRMRWIASEEDPFLARYEGRMDGVLVDAPCSGTGTIRRNPDILWRAIDLEALAAAQGRILAAAAKLVAPGGRLVYATCSLVREENEGVVESFLAAHEAFRLVPAGEVLARQGIALGDAVTKQGLLRLMPHRHHTDGFRAAVMQRES